jgi:hypothetical protein
LQQDSSKKATFLHALIAGEHSPNLRNIFRYVRLWRRSRYDQSACICGHVAMFVSLLPPKPNFDMLAAAAPASADRR